MSNVGTYVLAMRHLNDRVKASLVLLKIESILLLVLMSFFVIPDFKYKFHDLTKTFSVLFSCPAGSMF